MWWGSLPPQYHVLLHVLFILLELHARKRIVSKVPLTCSFCTRVGSIIWPSIRRFRILMVDLVLAVPQRSLYWEWFTISRVALYFRSSDASLFYVSIRGMLWAAIVTWTSFPDVPFAEVLRSLLLPCRALALVKDNFPRQLQDRTFHELKQVTTMVIWY